MSVCCLPYAGTDDAEAAEDQTQRAERGLRLGAHLHGVLFAPEVAARRGDRLEVQTAFKLVPLVGSVPNVESRGRLPILASRFEWRENATARGP